MQFCLTEPPPLCALYRSLRLIKRGAGSAGGVLAVDDAADAGDSGEGVSFLGAVVGAVFFGEPAVFDHDGEAAADHFFFGVDGVELGERHAAFF